MKTRLSLRVYLAATFAVFNFGTSILLAVITFSIIEVSERTMGEHLLVHEAEMLTNYFVDHPEGLTVYADHFKLYITGPGQHDIVPQELTAINRKIDEVEINNVEYFLIRTERAPYTYYYLYNFSEFEEFEQSMELYMLAFILFALVSGVGVGVLASGKILKPIQRLTDCLEHSDKDTGLVHISADFNNDEVGLLANKFIEYNARIKAYIDREKAFTSNASHELRTPVSIIAGAVELLEDSSTLSAEDRDIVLRIKDEVNAMHELIMLLLALSRGAQPEGHHDQFSVNNLIQANIDNFREQADAQGIELIYTQNAELVINGNLQAMDIVIRNLLSNAIQYTRNGTITIAVNHDSLSITDSGPGIQSDIQDKVFERFFRAQNQPVSENIGVGLALVRQLCEMNNWIITLAKGHNDQGTEVKLHFPTR